MPSAQAGSGPSGTEGGAGCSRQGPSPRCFSSSERGAWSKRGRALAPINLAVSQECPLLDLCNVSFFQRYFKGRLCSSRAVDLCVLTCQPPDSGRPQPVSAPSPPHTLWSASPPSTSVSAVGAAVVPQGPRARGAIRMPRARGPLLCLLASRRRSVQEKTACQTASGHIASLTEQLAGTLAAPGWRLLKSPRRQEWCGAPSRSSRRLSERCSPSPSPGACRQEGFARCQWTQRSTNHTGDF